jgi:hypothetical protein
MDFTAEDPAAEGEPTEVLRVAGRRLTRVIDKGSLNLLSGLILKRKPAISHSLPLGAR